MLVHAAVAAALRDNGVHTVFGVIGDANMLWVADFIEDGGRYIGSVDERGAVQMANSYTRISEGLGVATVTHGPGLTNAVTSIVEAARARTAMVIITGDTPGVRAHIAQIDMPALIGSTGAAYRRVLQPAHVVDEMAMAFQLARAQERPVVLDVPSDLLRQEVDHARSAFAALPPQAVRPDEDAIDRALGVIASSHRPIILAGRGAALAGARKELVELAEAIGAPIGTSLLGRDLFRGELFDLGVIGTVAHGIASETVAASDCVIAFGAGLNQYTTDRGSLAHGRALVQVDTDPKRFGQYVPVTAAVVGDARIVARTMVEQLLAADHRPGSFRSDDLRKRLEERDPADEFVDTSTESTVDVRTAMIKLNELFPNDRILVTDVGRFLLAAWKYVHVAKPVDFTYTGNFGSIGLGVAGAIGAAAADTSRPTLGIVGDGGGMMGLIEFSTAVRHGLPLVLVVVNDGCYGAEWDGLEDFGVDPKLSLMQWPEFADVARALGGHGITVRSKKDFDAVADLVRDQHLPLLVDVKTNPALRIGNIR